jgi:hypothetical protein
MHELTDFRAADGSRHFLSLPQSALFDDIRDHVEKLPGARLTGYLTDGIVEVWIDFQYSRYSFTINNQFGEYWFFVADPTCPQELLIDIAEHFGKLLPRRSG